MFSIQGVLQANVRLTDKDFYERHENGQERWRDTSQRDDSDDDDVE
ncbi:unnamed protein product, partial [Nippostrongylus brasiliensis]